MLACMPSPSSAAPTEVKPSTQSSYLPQHHRHQGYSIESLIPEGFDFGAVKDDVLAYEFLYPRQDLSGNPLSFAFYRKPVRYSLAAPQSVEGRQRIVCGLVCHHALNTSPITAMMLRVLLIKEWWCPWQWENRQNLWEQRFRSGASIQLPTPSCLIGFSPSWLFVAKVEHDCADQSRGSLEHDECPSHL